MRRPAAHAPTPDAALSTDGAECAHGGPAFAAKYSRQSGTDRVQLVIEPDMYHIYPLVDFAGAPSQRALAQWAQFLSATAKFA